ncbi:hydantoin racemase HyuA [Escherichia coli]|uniref:aspartate/glutamate racemase family protein n=1 Tax=Escherichia coli TaxID=562 RepID=UPI00193C612E|nr:aspartate/glutamate racemase family protein [Escherichia coli]MBM2914939.1 hydantoin racemase HyuA [Escherichia coli]
MSTKQTVAAGTIHVINASSRVDTGITDELARTLRAFGDHGRIGIRCITLENGPNGIVNACDSDRAAPPILDYISREASSEDALGFVVACFSNPGVFAAREITSKPVVGIGEAGIAVATAFGEQIGLLAMSSKGGPGDWRAVRTMGLAPRVCGRVHIEVDYGRLHDEAYVGQCLGEGAIRLRDQYGANVVVLAGAGLGRYAQTLKESTGLIIIDPVFAAFAAVLSNLILSDVSRF